MYPLRNLCKGDCSRTTIIVKSISLQIEMKYQLRFISKFQAVRTGKSVNSRPNYIPILDRAMLYNFYKE